MTTWESIDNVERTDNLIVTSDAAFERVSSNEHFEEESERGFLKQNTSWLVQEIPNISFLDIADTMLESQKTLYDRENWVLRVGKAGRSIEAQPQDIVTFNIDADYVAASWEHYIEFDSSFSSQNYTVCKPGQKWNIYTVEILQTWYYTISYGWWLKPGSATDVKISVGTYDTPIQYLVIEEYKDSSLPEIMSWWRFVPNVLLNEWEEICMRIDTNASVTIQQWTYFNVQFQQYNI